MLSVSPVEFNSYRQRCTSSSLRALGREPADPSSAQDTSLLTFDPTTVDGGERHCWSMTGVKVAERSPSMSPWGFHPEHGSFKTLPGRVDCRERCPVVEILTYGAVVSYVDTKRFVRSEEGPVDVFRTETACREAPQSHVCPTLAAGVR